MAIHMAGHGMASHGPWSRTQGPGLAKDSGPCALHWGKALAKDSGPWALGLAHGIWVVLVECPRRGFTRKPHGESSGLSPGAWPRPRTQGPGPRRVELGFHGKVLVTELYCDTPWRAPKYGPGKDRPRHVVGPPNLKVVEEKNLPMPNQHPSLIPQLLPIRDRSLFPIPH